MSGEIKELCVFEHRSANRNRGTARRVEYHVVLPEQWGRYRQGRKDERVGAVQRLVHQSAESLRRGPGREVLDGADRPAIRDAGMNRRHISIRATVEVRRVPGGSLRKGQVDVGR